MWRDENDHTGLALGAWGAVQATAAGVGIALGGAIRDLSAAASDLGLFGPVLQGPAVGYGVVYTIELVLLFATLACIGPLVRFAQPPAVRRQRFGLAELPG
jgi:BCD family chlorophyll transporter-like MFS transporter